VPSLRVVIACESTQVNTQTQRDAHIEGRYSHVAMILAAPRTDPFELEMQAARATAVAGSWPHRRGP
jgi:hypothetical protein